MRLLKNAPFLKKGTDFIFYDSTVFVYWIENGKETQYPLRTGLAGYLWLLMTEKGYFKTIDISNED